MRRLLLRGVLVITLAAVAAACGDDPTIPTQPTVPTVVTETFTGTLTVNGAVTFPFAVSQAGSANSSMKALQPLLTLRVAAGGAGDYTVGETVFQGAALASATVTGVVSGWNSGTRLLTLSSTSATGSFIVDTPVIGGTNGATWTTSEVIPAVVGMALGTWSGTTCSVVLANDLTGVGGAVAGTVQGAGVLCARVYDVGRLLGPTTFTIDVTHF